GSRVVVVMPSSLVRHGRGGLNESDLPGAACRGCVRTCVRLSYPPQGWEFSASSTDVSKAGSLSAARSRVRIESTDQVGTDQIRTDQRRTRNKTRSPSKDGSAGYEEGIIMATATKDRE